MGIYHKITSLAKKLRLLCSLIKSYLRGQIVVKLMDPPTPPLEDQNSESELKPGNPCGIAPEIWDTIFGYLENGEDLESVAKTCQAFEDVAEYVKSKRMRDILMPEVLQILTKKDVLKSMHIQVTDLILPLRGVCKHWQNVVDKLCDDQLVKCHSEYLSCEFYLRNIVIRGEEELNQLVNSYDSNASSGIHAQRLIRKCLQISTGDYAPKYYEDVTRLLRIIGPQIWNFTINFNGPRRSYSKPEDLLVTWTKLLPNMRYLNIWWWQPDLTPKEKESAKWTWKENPFPALKKLQKIIFNENQDKRFPFASHLLKPNYNVAYLVIDLEQLLMCLESAHKLNLESLSLELNDDEFETTTADIQPVLNYNWPLKFFDIGLGGEFTTKEFFPLLERFKETLEILILDVLLVDNEVNLDLPKLTKIRLIIHEDCDNIDFLLQCQNLKNLTLVLIREPDGHVHYETVEYFDTKVDKEKVQLRGYLNNFYESNAWKLFPSLEDVTIEFDHWRKKSYKRVAHIP